MSKTVKRVMTVMMIGLVAMLGVKAEAHYLVIKGRCVWHSLECGREDTDVPPPPPLEIDAIVNSALIGETPVLISEVVATPKEVEILCADGSEISPPMGSVILASQKRIGRGDFTEQRGEKSNIIQTNLEFDGIISDALFLEKFLPDSDKQTCPGSMPTDVIVRAMKVEVNLYCSSEDDKKCVGKPGEPHSSWKAGTCSLPDEFKFEKKPPFRGALFNCSQTERCHQDPQGKGLVCEKL